MMSAISIAYYLIKKAKEKSELTKPSELASMTPLKLQKLLYFAQGTYLRNHLKALFDDPIQAWGYGPVVPSVWRHLKKKGFTYQNLSQEMNMDEIKNKADEVPDKYRNFLDKFFKVYAKYDANTLVSTTHNHSIWQEAYRSYDNRITVKEIQSFFKSL